MIRHLLICIAFALALFLTFALAGCAEFITPDRSICRIQMLEDSSDYVIAHEFRHCFGYAHRSPT